MRGEGRLRGDAQLGSDVALAASEPQDSSSESARSGVKYLLSSGRSVARPVVSDALSASIERIPSRVSERRRSRGRVEQ